MDPDFYELSADFVLEFIQPAPEKPGWTLTVKRRGVRGILLTVATSDFDVLRPNWEEIVKWVIAESRIPLSKEQRGMLGAYIRSQASDYGEPMVHKFSQKNNQTS